MAKKTASWLIAPALRTLLLLLPLSALFAQPIPQYLGFKSYEDFINIDRVTINGVTRTSDCNTLTTGPNSVRNEYSNYTDLGQLCVLTPGQYVSYSAHLKSCWTFFDNYVHCVSSDIRTTNAVYVDWNHDNDFGDPGELIHVSNTSGEVTIEGNLFVPLDAAGGLTLVRVMMLSETNIFPNLPTCEYSTSLTWLETMDVMNARYLDAGEIEDHYIRVEVQPMCSGLPPAGQTASTQNHVCEADSFTLYTTGIAYRESYQFQWQKSFDAVQYTNIPGATAFTLKTSQGGSTYYRRATTCTSSGEQNYSAPFRVLSKSFTQCYCVPFDHVIGPASDITRVAIGDGSNPSACTSGVPYRSYHPLGPLAVVNTGETVPVTVTGGGTGCEDQDDGTKYSVEIYVDINQNGSFEDEGEMLYNSDRFLAPHEYVGAITIPDWARPGVTGLRVFYHNRRGYSSVFDACEQYGGEVEDYLIEILPCPGVRPVDGYIDPVASVCPGDPFSLKVRCATERYDDRYEWLVSSDGNFWETVPGATGAEFQGTQASAQYYRRKTTRYLTNELGLSNMVQVGMKPFYLCYCLAAEPPVNDPDVTLIESVTIQDVGSSNTVGFEASLCSPSSFNLYNFDRVFATLEQGGAYRGSIKGCKSYNALYRISIDYNQDGVFDHEDQYVFNALRNEMPATFKIPKNIPIGITGMRVEIADGDPLPDCSGQLKNEVEIHLVHITGCSGTPLGGITVAASGNIACRGDVLNLSVTDDSPAEQKLQYQWQILGPNNSWQDIAGATQSTLQTVFNSGDPASYRRRSACASNAAWAFSQAVVIEPDAPQNCYCASSANNDAGMDIGQVTFGGAVKSSSCGLTGGNGSLLKRYSDYRGEGAIEQISLGQTVSFEVNTIYCEWEDFNRLGIFVDFNADGVFNGAEETVYLSQTMYGNHTFSGTFTVPMNAKTDLTGLRFVLTNGSAPQPCGAYAGGETEDYFVTIVGCEGDPTPGVTQASRTRFCSLAPDVVFSVTGDSPNQPGIQYQWQASPDGSNWDDIPGATQAACTTNVTLSYYFRRRIRCTSGEVEAFSVPVFVEKTPLACYCSSLANSNAGPDVSTVGINGVAHTQPCDAPAGSESVPGRYTNNTNLGPLFRAKIGISNSFQIGIGPCDNSTFSTGWAMFIDYNRNGSFLDAGETVLFSNSMTSGAYGQTLPFTVPNTTAEGLTVMRVVAADQLGNTLSPCSAYNIGETVDYLVEILQPCTGPVIYVDASATGANTGKNWNDALTDLQDALALKEVCPGVEEIWVAAGVYKPTAGSSRSVSFALKNGVALYGGFQGAETARSERNFRTNVTILSGNINDTGSAADNSYHVITSNGNNNTAVIDGFTIRDGYANHIGDNQGGGFYINNSAPVIRNCIVRDNAARFASSTDYGAAMAIYNSSCMVESCMFTDNIDQTNTGKGCIFVTGGGPTTFTNCVFYNNSGGISANDGANVTLVNCTVVNNAPASIAAKNASLTVRNSILRGNPVSVQGTAPTISYSITPTALSGTGNLDVDPIFLNVNDPDGLDNVFATSDDGLVLLNCSRAIDAGWDADCPALSDLTGKARKVDGLTGGQSVDMGAYEFADIVAIPNAICKPSIAVLLHENGSATVRPDDIDGGSNKPCNGLRLINGSSLLTLSCADIGTKTATLSVLSTQNVAPSTCQTIIMVSESVHPMITCPTRQYLNMGGGCSTLLGSWTSVSKSDNCTPPGAMSETQSPDASTVLSNQHRVQMVTLTTTDASGNTGTCQFEVIWRDNTKPIIACPADQTVSANENCAGTVGGWTLASKSDNCAQTIFEIQSPATNTPFGGLNETIAVTLTAFDGNGNSETCQFAVTLKDKTPPTVACQNITVYLDGSGTASIAAAQVFNAAQSSDHCGTVAVQYISSSMFTCNHLGANTVTLAAHDGHGNTRTCTAIVTVLDNIAPSIVCPANIVRGNDAGQCGAAVTYALPIASDNCGSPITSRQSGANTASGSTFPKGITTVTWQASDGAVPPNTATCSFTVTVNDTEAPALTCPASQTIGTTPTLCTGVATFATPAGSDNCPLPAGAVTQTGGLASGSSFPKGITTVIFKVTDASGLTKTCTFKITVNDTENPVITCPSSQSRNADTGLCTAVTTYSMPTATDNCAPAPTVVRVSGPASGSAFSVGTTTCVWRSTDGASRSSTCSFMVTVTDNQAPGISCPANQSVTAAPGQCSATFYYSNPTATDNCGVISVYLLNGLASGSLFPQGATVNTWRAVDVNGLSQTCSFSVTVACGTGAQGGESERRSDATFEKSRNLSNLDLRLWPNPAVTEVQLVVENLGDAGGDLAVYNAQGRLMWRRHEEAPSSLGGQPLVVSMADFTAGVYFVTLCSEGQTVTKRLVVSRR